MKSGKKQARWLRDGDRVTLHDGSVGIVQELPYLSRSGLVRSHVQTGSAMRLAAWEATDIVSVESDSEQGWIE